jgi:phage terminase large subunit-like protein
LPPEDCRNFLKILKDDELEFFLRWEKCARADQLPPSGSWRIWLFMGGRGAGKTRAGAEWIAHGIHSDTMRRIALIGATHHDVRAVMIEGESGLLHASEGAVYQPSNQRVLWPSGAVATVLSADEPDSIRGHQFDAAWGDEFCKWPEPQAALDMLEMTLRLGKQPRLLLTTTPRNIPALKALFDRGDVEMTHSTTRDNIANLAPGFVASLEARYGGTRLGRQELEAQIIADNDEAMWRRDWIEAYRVRERPELTRIVVGVDPCASAHGAECGIVVVGCDEKSEGYVLADRSIGGLTPLQWATRVNRAYLDYEADKIIAESNQGGDMVRQTLRNANHNAPVKLVHARRGKKLRAEPYAALYEQGRIHHVGCFAELEDQMCNWDGKGESPDRMDALVYALAELFPAKDIAVPKIHAL